MNNRVPKGASTTIWRLLFRVDKKQMFVCTSYISKDVQIKFNKTKVEGLDPDNAFLQNYAFMGFYKITQRLTNISCDTNYIII